MDRKDYVGKDELCCYDEDINVAKSSLLKDETLYDLAEFFKVLGDSTRIKIISVLFKKEFCVGDIAYAINVSQSAVSHQLRILKANSVVRSRRVGKMICYTLDDKHVEKIFNIGLKHIKHIED